MFMEKYTYDVLWSFYIFYRILKCYNTLVQVLEYFIHTSKQCT